MTIIAIAIKIDSPGSVFFKQKRLSYKGKVFEIIKFRSMCVGAEHTGSGVYSGKGYSRVTHVGNILRKTSLDEISQFFNTLKGEMSFIGDRDIIGTTKKKLDFIRVLAAGVESFYEIFA